MICLVMQTHQAGVRLTKEELAATAPAKGDLILFERAAKSTAFERAIRTAELKGIETYTPDVFTPLFDPVLVRMTMRGFLIVGMQSRAENGRAVLYAQGWWCQPAPGATRELRASRGPDGRFLEFDGCGNVKK